MAEEIKKHKVNALTVKQGYQIDEGLHKVDSLTLLEVFQICDSTFPVGTFNHSFGMENYIVDGRIKKAPQFKEWFTSYYMNQFTYGEGLLVKLCYEALKEDKIDRLWTYDDTITVSTIATETRNGAKLIAKQMLDILHLLSEDIPLLDVYLNKIKQKEAFGNPAIVFAIFAYYKGLPLKEAFLWYGYNVASTLVQNAVRSIPLGQKEGQVILHDTIELIGHLYHRIQHLNSKYLGANVPGLELAQIRHETQLARLFMS
ncbi:MAG: urease accessory protein UreF [Veillonellaceae bacterium]|nr:urease accessory protein UreF [Veillonellaceae bacterium]